MYNFTIYKVAILNKAKEEQMLNLFNGENDLLEICNQYYNSLRENNEEYIDNQGNKRVFSISSKIDFLRTERTLITHFDSAYTGDEPEIRNGDTNALIHKVSNTELITRKLFSLCYIPKNSKYGFVVFENKVKHGVKVLFERQLQTFLKTSGYEDYRVLLSPALNYNYLSNMIEIGKLKKVRLIKYHLLHDVQMSLWDNINLFSDDQDVREWKFKNKTNNDLFKKELKNLFFLKVKRNEKILFMNKFEGDEISFEINNNGSSKTFYIKDRASMRSNIDVSKRLDFIDGEPTYLSMKITALNLIYEILDYDYLNLNEVA
ncbi:hypothetical protein [Lacinutrix jangbogonensis]|uniref:hypothetical protein n=1 Tax=Lacinutrix jangbogonensis TaxID=1469557 RepID=UPI00053EBA59|nr:hypothetical protein [Lacinutrix jangbogonensis]